MTALNSPLTLVCKTTTSGLKLQADVYPLSLKDTASVPIVLFFQICGLIFGSRGDGLFPLWLKKAAREQGWPLVSVDYRLIRESKIEDILEDARHAWSL